MTIEKYLVISASERSYGYLGKPNVVMRDRTPKLKGNEISLKLVLSIPDAVFKRPQLEAKLSIPQEVIPKNLITPEVADNIEKVIKESTGLNISVALVEQEDKKNETTVTSSGEESTGTGRRPATGRSTR